MPRSSDTELRSSCPVAASLDVLGDRWTLVVLRDLVLGGVSHFADFAVDEAIATNTLAERLQRLRDAGVIARVRDPEDGRRWIYVPRQPAIELIPVLIDLMIWGIANTAADVPPEKANAAERRDELIKQFTAAASTRVVD
ncbi:MAG: winged helix-turn-helix transcriptional regulator [Ilumatobacter sp.]|jgi:DNA-binding HxlR family transcriptional regulator|uniref:winged helix-turn-helix transcriptional regulator n=1 Tax=Ilumatobacter sp. TaxID=1967498 RepID=UPI00391A3955